MTELVINFDEYRERQAFIDRVRSFTGKLKVTVCKYRRGRTNPQLAYYFAEHVTKFADWLRDQDETATKEKAHAILKERFVFTEVMSAKTGEVIKSPGSTGDFDVEQFSLYLDQVSKFLFDFCDITVEPAGKLCATDR